jgi:hypothetical protein
MEKPRLAEILDTLVEQWCARRALEPLRFLLQAWPAPLVLSDEWHELWRALRNVQGLRPGILTPEESDLSAEALRLVNGSLRAVGQSPYDR